MRKIFQLTIFIFLVAGLSGCGVKGKPLPPLNKGDSKNEPPRKKGP